MWYKIARNLAEPTNKVEYNLNIPLLLVFFHENLILEKKEKIYF